jgi:hypothetical protein
MRNKFKIFVLLALLTQFAFLYLVLWSGCKPVTEPVIDWGSSAKFVNLRSGASLTVYVEGTQKGTLAFGNASDYFDLPSGSRVFVFDYGAGKDTVRQSLESEKKYSIFYVSGTDVLFASERCTCEPPYPKATALVRFLHLSPDLGTTKVIVNFAGKDSVFSNVAFKGGTPYLAIPDSLLPAKYTVIAGTDTVVKAWDSGVSGAGRYSVVVYGPKASLQKKLFKED